MEHHASTEVKDLFDKDVASGKIDLINDEYLRSIKMYNVFIEHVNKLRILFDPEDLGEAYAIALAEVIGCMSIVTDDIKPQGPHYMLMRTPDSEVIPFAFYELLLLEYLENRLTEKELEEKFNEIGSISDLKWNFYSKTKDFIRRFWTDVYTDSEKAWMILFCKENEIDSKQRVQKLIQHINKKAI